MTTTIKRPPIQWVGCQNKEMCVQAGVSSDTLKYWRVTGLLPKGIYWYTLPNSDRIVWVRDLVRDWLVNGSDSPEHKRAVSKYMASLPSSGAYNPSAG